MAEDPEHLRLGPLEVRLERVVYATVVLMSVLAVYDGWASLTTFAGVVDATGASGGIVCDAARM